VSLAGGRRLGHGPHTRTECVASGQFVDNLAAVVAELREAALSDKRSIDWPRFDHFCRQAVVAGEAGEHTQAVREYAHAISFMMQQLRSQPNK
jgi:hypothetical protein